jgi:hypothetical protein
VKCASVMVQRLIYIVLLTLLGAVSVALTQELKPEEGFKGLRWGASVEETTRSASSGPSTIGRLTRSVSRATSYIRWKKRNR